MHTFCLFIQSRQLRHWARGLGTCHFDFKKAPQRFNIAVVNWSLAICVFDVRIGAQVKHGLCCHLIVESNRHVQSRAPVTIATVHQAFHHLST